MFVVAWCLTVWLVCLCLVWCGPSCWWHLLLVISVRAPGSRVGVHISGEDWVWYVCDVLYAVLYVRVSCFVVPGCAVSRRYINVCNCDMFNVVNVYLDHLKFCVVCINGHRYAGCSECNVVSNECQESTSCLLKPIGMHGGEVMYFGCVCFRGELGFLNCDDICMCVVNKKVEFIEFVFDSVYVVDLQYDEISPTFTAGSVSLCCVCSHVVVLVCLWGCRCTLCGYGCCCDCDACTVICHACLYAERVWGCYGYGNAGVGNGRGVKSQGIWVVHVVQVLCLAQLTCYVWWWCVGWEELMEYVRCVCVWLGVARGVSRWEDWVLLYQSCGNRGSVGRVSVLRWCRWGVGRGLGPGSGGVVLCLCEFGFSV